MIAVPRCPVPHPFHGLIVKRVGGHGVDTPLLELPEGEVYSWLASLAARRILSTTSPGVSASAVTERCAVRYSGSRRSYRRARFASSANTGRMCPVPRQRASVVANSISRWTSSVPSPASRSARVSSRSIAPPPSANTSASSPASRAIVSCSRSRNAGSPRRANSSAIVQPASASITSSTSTNRQPSRAASNGPTVLLPEPMKPVSTMRRGVRATPDLEPICEVTAASIGNARRRSLP